MVLSTPASLEQNSAGFLHLTIYKKLFFYLLYLQRYIQDPNGLVIC